MFGNSHLTAFTVAKYPQSQKKKCNTWLNEIINYPKETDLKRNSSHKPPNYFKKFTYFSVNTLIVSSRAEMVAAAHSAHPKQLITHHASMLPTIPAKRSLIAD